ncbi:MAG: PKD domain-containing protein [Bacteroidota bacterium]
MRQRILGVTSFFLLFCLLDISAWAQPIAGFNASTPTTRCAPQALVVSFVNTTTNGGAGTTYEWSTSTVPAQTSTLEQPTFIYTQPGCYDVTLIATNAFGSDTITQTCFVEIYAQPEPGFVVDPLEICAPGTIQFTDTSVANSAGGIVDWLWILSVNNYTSTLQNPNFLINVPNDTIDVILRVTNSNGCETTTVFNDEVISNEPPVADFSVDINSACNPPLTVNFTNNSNENGLSNITYEWQFPGGVTPTGASTFNGLTPPPVTYALDGQYDVTLIVSGNNTCTDTLTFPNMIGIGGVTADFTSNVTSVCLGDPVNFQSTSSGGVTSIGWDFGEVPGIDATDAITSYTYSTPGTYTVSLFANNVDCGDTLIRTSYITVEDTPTASFSVDRNLDCQPGNPFFFTDQSSNNTTWSWDFGDGNTSTQQSPSHTYTSFGEFPVVLTVGNVAGCTKTITDTIVIAPPNGSFTFDPSEGCAPLDVQFNDNSSSPVDPIVSYEWIFPGQGVTPSSSTVSNPSVNYSQTGDFNVILIIQTANGCTDTVRRANAVNVGELPVSTFTVDKDTVCIFEPITFLADSENVDWTYLWDFQYVAPGAFQDLGTHNPGTVYPDTGLFSVGLIVDDNGCRDTTIVNDLVFVSPPRAEFTTSETLICSVPQDITFSDSSIGPADVYTWMVNGVPFAAFSGPQVPTPYTISTPGTYVFQQAILNTATGCTDTATVIVNAGDPVASFTTLDTSGCRAHTVNLVNNSQNTLVNRSRYFVSRDGVPVVNFQATKTNTVLADTGIYDFMLVARDQFGCSDTAFEQGLVEVFGVYASNTVDRNPACPNETIQFEETAVVYKGSVTARLFDFPGAIDPLSTIVNPTNSYAAGGLYTVRLFVQDSNGCTDSIGTQVTITEPEAAFFTSDTSTCAGNDLLFINRSNGVGLSYFWDFGDGDTTSDRRPTHAFFPDDSLTGTFYDITLIATDVNGCSDTLVRDDYIFIEPFDIRFFASDTVAICPPLSVQIFDTSAGNPVLWDWYFDAAGFALGVDSPQVGAFFQVPGSYDVLAIGTHEDGCRDTLLKEDYIFVAGPSGTYSVFPNEVCEGDTVCVRAETFGANTAVILYGDGSTDIFDSTTLSGFVDTIEVCHVYTSDGMFFPQIVLTDDRGCTFTPDIQDSARVFRRPTAIMSPIDTFGCSAFTVPFFDLSLPGDTTISAWRWDFATGDTSNLQNPVYTYFGDTIYNDLSLIVTDDNGCRDTTTTGLTVYEGAVPQFFAPDTTGCAPFTAVFQDSSFGSVPPSAWTWIFGDGDTLTGVTPPVAHTYNQDGLYTVTLIISDNLGCADTLTKVDYINLFRPQPVVYSSQNVGCNPITITFFGDSTVSNRSIQSYEWCLVDINSNDTTCSTTVAPVDTFDVTFPDEGDYLMILTVFDSLGCSEVSAPHPITIRQTIVPDPVDIINVSVLTESTVEINWNAYTGADFQEYVIYRLDGTNNIEIGRLIDVDSVSFVDNTPGLDPETNSYCYKVSIINDCDEESDLNLTDEHCTVELMVTPILDGLVLDWNGYIGFNVAQYEIYRATDYSPGSLQQIAVVNGNVTTYTDLETFCYDSISYRVRAIGLASIQESSFSDLAGEAPIHLPPTEVSDVVTATVVNDSYVQVDWVDYTGYLPDEYILEKSLDGSFYSILNQFPIGTTSFDDNDVAVDDFSYYYRLQVVDQCGDTSNYGNFGKSILLTTRLEGTTPILTWTDYEEWDLGVRNYRVEILNETTGQFEVVERNIAGTETRFEDLISNFPTQWQYCYRVVAEEAAGNNAEAVSNESCVPFPPRVYIPNAFTPNNEGPTENERFTINLPRVRQAEVSIFNRWGERIYYTTDWTQFWDGTFKGQPVQEGVYVYVISGIGFNEDEFYRTGTVTLIR